jgi:hypothetical protein
MEAQDYLDSDSTSLYSSKYPEGTSLLFCLIQKKRITLLGVDFTDKDILVVIIADAICPEVVAPSQLSPVPSKIRHILHYFNSIPSFSP